ncbi:hypothetical protein ACPW96_16625 [Micromonospora sp. DT81.3]|uniref:hypothetical protein n=1 Tax=Micromonospora sp. DT81.3 TaxID=3416523 RepID=UPI003CF4D1DE
MFGTEMAAGLIGAVVGALLGWLWADIIYRRQRRDAAAMYAHQRNDAEANYRRLRDDAEAAYQEQKADAEASYQKKLSDAKMRTSIERVVRFHDQCTAAKDWLRNLPNWGDALQEQEHDLRSEASTRANACYVAWDQAQNAQFPQRVQAVMDSVKVATAKALGQVHRNENLTPDMAALQVALGDFRQTVNEELHTDL